MKVSPSLCMVDTRLIRSKPVPFYTEASRPVQTPQAADVSVTESCLTVAPALLLNGKGQSSSPRQLEGLSSPEPAHFSTWRSLLRPAVAVVLGAAGATSAARRPRTPSGRKHSEHKFVVAPPRRICLISADVHSLATRPPSEADLVLDFHRIFDPCKGVYTPVHVGRCQSG